MAERQGQQGTGRHPHKDSQEPWPHTKEGGKEGGKESGRQHESRGHEQESRGREKEREPAHAGASKQDGSRSGGGSEDADLKSREYRDDKGEVHHHTRTYMEQHGGKGGTKE